MKIALVMENSQAAKNPIVEKALKSVVEPMGHEVFNYGMYSAEDENQLTYVQIGILAAVLLNSKACDLVITGCGTGEGAMYPSYFRFVYNGQYFVPASVEAVEGKVMFAEKVLEDNTRFAMLGNDDGVAHFNYVELSHEKHTIKVTFKPIG